jgi:hypothetical protein
MNFTDDGRADPGELWGSDQENRFKIAVQLTVDLRNTVLILVVSSIPDSPKKKLSIVLFGKLGC